MAVVGGACVGNARRFRRLVGWRKAIVDPISGLTRDRLYGVCEWLGHEFTVVDTAGLELDAGLNPDRDFSQADIEAQTRVAIEEANAIVFLLDVRQGLTAVDRDIAQLLRRSGRQVIVAANKADNFGQEHFRHEILELGFPEVLMISAEHGIGVADLLDRVLEALPPGHPGARGGNPATAARAGARAEGHRDTHNDGSHRSHEVRATAAANNVHPVEHS